MNLRSGDKVSWPQKFCDRVSRGVDYLSTLILNQRNTLNKEISYGRNQQKRNRCTSSKIVLYFDSCFYRYWSSYLRRFLDWKNFIDVLSGLSFAGNWFFSAIRTTPITASASGQDRVSLFPKTKTINAHLADIPYPLDGHFSSKGTSKNVDVQFSLKHHCVLLESTHYWALSRSVQNEHKEVQLVV